MDFFDIYSSNAHNSNYPILLTICVNQLITASKIKPDLQVTILDHTSQVLAILTRLVKKQ